MDLVAVRVENLRGFDNVYVPLEADPLVLVGPNNSGKTGLLQLLDWIFNGAPDDLLRGERPLSEEERSLLLPARSTRNRPRRITMYVDVPDRRRHRSLLVSEGICDLRLRVVRDHMYVNLGPPRRSEPASHDPKALGVLNEVRAETRFTLIPADRGAGLSWFSDQLATRVERQLETRAVHREQGGAPTEYRKISRALRDIRGTLEELAAPLWPEIRSELLPGMTTGGSFQLDFPPERLVRLVAEMIDLRLTTGSHDSRTVAPHDVGSGLQSLLHVSLLRPRRGGRRSNWVAIEEPEAYLHPSAQRMLARKLFGDPSIRLITTTHSPLFVDEARYESVMVVRDHSFYPAREEPSQRNDINSALLSGLGAELPFCQSVLFVEGEGDRLFFESLRRRVAEGDESGICDRLLVLPVGGKNRFGPWIRLADSFRDDASRAVRFLVTADGIDAASDVRAAFRNAGYSIPMALGPRWDAVIGARGNPDQTDLKTATVRFNEVARRIGFRLHLLPIDLEWAALEAATDATVRRISRRVDWSVSTRDRLLGALESKAESASGAAVTKQPWIRKVVAEELPVEEISVDVVSIMQRWLFGATGNMRRANDILRAGGWIVSRR